MGLFETAVGRTVVTACTMLAQDSREVRNRFMAKKLLHCCICGHARAHMHFLRRMCMHFDRCSGLHACANVYVRQVLYASAYTFAYTLATGCAYVLMHVQFVRSALGERGCRVQLVYESTCCLSWGVIFDRRKDRGVVCVFSIFNAGGSVCGCVCVYTHTHPQLIQ